MARRFRQLPCFDLIETGLRKEYCNNLAASVRYGPTGREIPRLPYSPNSGQNDFGAPPT
jgi:hypothetical protein